MDKLKNLNKIIKDIKRVCNEIQAKSLPIMKILTEADNDITDEILDNIKFEVEVQVVLEEAQNITLSLISDSKIIKGHIDNFIVFTENGFELSSKCELLYQAWTGDLYDKSEIEGLNELKLDLEKQLQNISEEYIIEKTIEKLNLVNSVSFS